MPILAQLRLHKIILAKHGRGGRSLTQEWGNDLRTSMELQVHGYLNFFTTGAPLASAAGRTEFAKVRIEDDVQARRRAGCRGDGG